MNRSLTRRGFLRRSAVTAAAVACPTIIPSSALGLAGTVAPSNRITVGLIGLGQEGHLKNVRSFLQEPDAEIVALCDVIEQRIERAHLVLQTYPDKPNITGYKNCFLTMDWRELVDRSDIDAVIVSTPDHWHALCSIGALRAGKHVMCEKPIAHTIREGRVMSDTAKRYARVCQVATEVRFMPQLLHGARMVRNGRIGRLHTIRVKMYGGYGMGDCSNPPLRIQKPPPGFDYDMWLGPAPEAPFTLDRCNGMFRFMYDYGGGNICEWGPHMLDIAMLGNDTEYTGPVRVEGTAEFSHEGLFDTPIAFHAKYEFANGVTLHCETGTIEEMDPYEGAYVHFEGDEGWIRPGFLGIEASRDELRTERLGPGDDPLVIPAHEGMEHRAFLDAVKREQPCLDSVEAAHRVASVAHLGNIAFRLGVPLEWDPAAERFTNNEAANRLLRPHMRAPWSLEG